MHISKIELRDWKVYKFVEFEFPAPTDEQNIILIGALNGYGKTSLYQAIILGMFGQDGMALIANSMFSEAEDSQERPYKVFLEKALHRGAIAQSRYSCSVKLVFVDDGEPIEVSRNWHFNNSGIYQPNDEEVKIFKGESREPIGPNSDEITLHKDRKNWYRAYIGRKFLPYHLAVFFVFDGEQVRKLAERDMKDQVKVGIEGLLGIPELRSLRDNLNDYANRRESNVKNVTDQNAEETQNAVNELQDKLDKNIRQYAEVSPKLSDAKTERDKIMVDFLALGVGAQTQSNQQYEQLTQCQSAIQKDNDKLKKFLSEGIALGLSGVKLRKQLKNRLESENIRAEWESAMQQGDSRIENFLVEMDQQMDGVEPLISDAQQDSVLKIARDAWSKLWFPPPRNCAKKYLHAHFTAHDRGIVIDKLNEQDRLEASEIINLLDSISKNESRYKQIREEIDRLESVEPGMNEKKLKLQKLETIIESLRKEVDKLENERRGLDGQLSAKRSELARMYGNIEAAKPTVRKTTRARDVATMMNKIIGKVVPKQMEKIGDEMTKAHRSMAHKTDQIERINIVDGDVNLLNKKGINVRDNDLSAGEEHIFTQSLFSAVSSVSKRSFPMVVDTPISRLDDKHRSGVLKHLAQRKGQVILLSTDTEIVGHYLQKIDSSVQKKYLIRYSMDGDIGRSTATLGYFGDPEAVE
ncbi:AAA family ATPase [Candidatus Spongiihabitans sp.]|uniref:AAA family ATPase n=1 Tax=Candidatus Spongiihabitans sp. TaxID=3101308 RepID=UPI003C7EC555